MAPDPWPTTNEVPQNVATAVKIAATHLLIVRRERAKEARNLWRQMNSYCHMASAQTGLYVPWWQL